MGTFVRVLIIALLAAGVLFAPTDQGTAYADDETDEDDESDTSGEDTTEETDVDDEAESEDEGDDQTETPTFNTRGMDDSSPGSTPIVYDSPVDEENTTGDGSADAPEDADDDEDPEDEGNQDADEDDDQTETPTSNATTINKPLIGSILLFYDNSVSSEAVRQMEGSALDIGIDVVRERIDFDSKYLRGPDPAAARDVDYILVLSRDVAGLDVLIDYVASEELLLDGREVIISSAVDRRVLEPHSLVLQKEASPDLIILTDLEDSELVWDATLSAMAQKRPVTEMMGERGVEFSTVDDSDLAEIPAYREAVSDTIIKVSESNIPLETLKLVLLLPFAATIVAIFRNIVGMKTYGVFGPAIMSTAFLSSGLVVGLILFTVLLATGVFARRLIERMNLMMVPRLAILLTMCCMVMAAAISIGIKMDTQYLARLTVFPLIIMAMIIENFMKTTVEKGLSDALNICFSTVIVSIACFIVVSNPTLQVIVMTHPEILLLVVGLNIWIGKWKGLRLVEYLRFSKIMKG